MNIVSVGLHNEGKNNEKGKSNLLNRIFYTNFVNTSTRHGITLACPEISLNIYGSKYACNLIDIGSKTSIDISNSLLKKANFIILHSWKTEKETNQEIQRIKQMCENVYILTVMRDISRDSKDNWIGRAKQLINDKI